MVQPVIQEMPVDVLRGTRMAVVSLAVAIAWLLLLAASVRANPPAEGIRAAAATVVDVPMALPSVLFLPPRLPAGAADMARAAAATACDRLAQDIAAGGLARVVDRTQLDHILQERKLQAEPPRTMLSYDAMLRLEADTTRLVPETRLSLIDLSTGNIIAQQAFAWPPSKAAAKAMLDFCRGALQHVAKPAAGKLRVRTLWSTEDIDNERIRPLGRRLIALFDESLRRSDRVLLLHHLEAATSKEESLLLLMGLSRLPGGRQFAPQADATIELALREGEGRGKSFQETPVEIHVRITRGGSGHDQSLATVGTVAQFDRAATETWEKLAAMLREAQPGAAASWLDEMAVRRRQAEAELRIVRTLRGDTRDFGRLLTCVAHAEAAMKLDPTCEEAVVERLTSLKDACLRAATVHKGETEGEVEEIAERTLAGAVQYFDRFDPSPANRAAAREACRVAMHLGLGDIYFSGTYFHGVIRWTPRRLAMIQSAKLLLEDSLKHGSRTTAAGYEAMALVIVGRAMKHAGLPREEREPWIDGVLQQCALDEAKTAKAELIAKRRSQDEYNRVWLGALGLALDDGRRDRARELIARLQDRIAAGPPPPWIAPVAELRELVARLDDAAALADFDRWNHELNNPNVQRLGLGCPAMAPYHDKDAVSRRIIRGVLPCVPNVLLRQGFSSRRGKAICALAADENRLYVVIDGWITWDNFAAMAGSGHSQVLASLPLDKAGRPIDKTDQVSQPTADTFRDTLKPLLQPSVVRPLQVLAARCLGGKLYLGTRHNGLLVYDPQSWQWSNIGPEQGLPDEAIHAIYPLDDHTLFCAGRDSGVCYTIELPEAKVTLRHRVGGNARWRTPLLYWRSGTQLLAWTPLGLCGDLLAPQFTFTERAPAAPFGWNVPGGGLHASFYGGFVSLAEIQGRRFVTNAGLHEFDATGKIVRSWWESNHYEDDRGGVIYRVPLPSDCPLQSMHMVVMGSVLVFVEPGSMLAWDPKSDTWYGPLAPGGDHAFGTPAGLWLGGRDGLRFVAADDLFAKAKGAGRVLTTAQYRQRQQEIIAAMPPLDRAKAAFSMHQFDKAKPLLQEVLQDDPASVEALLLMGCLHDVWCLNQPDTALQFYQRLADVKANRNASFTGWYQRFVLLRTLERWPETLAAIDQISQRFPRLREYERRELDWWRGEAGKHVRPAANQKAGR